MRHKFGPSLKVEGAAQLHAEFCLRRSTSSTLNALVTCKSSHHHETIICSTTHGAQYNLPELA
jgi:hypothetical protein